MQSKIEIFKKFILGLKEESKCETKKVAAIITDIGLQQVYAIGVNGGPRKQIHCLCNNDSKYSCVHAEINCLIKCEKTFNPKIMFTTLSPCYTCAATIVNSQNISTVYYIETWKDTRGLGILNQAMIQTIKI